MILIGIDPDVDKSGIAYYDTSDSSLELSNLSFFQLFDYLSWMKESGIKFKATLEAGWKNEKSNWHDEKSGSRVASLIGKHTGRNHETGRKIEEMLIYLMVEYELRIPNKNVHKIGKSEFNKLTKYKKQTNQDQRDAAMLVFGY
jgi:hypothetical protein